MTMLRGNNSQARSKQPYTKAELLGLGAQDLAAKAAGASFALTSTSGDNVPLTNVQRTRTEGRGRPNFRGGSIPYSVLRQAADDCEPMRLAIQHRKAQIQALGHKFVPKEGFTKEDVQADIETCQEFFGTRGGFGGHGRRFRSVIGSLVEDLLVIGCIDLYRGRSADGKVRTVKIVDAATIKPLLDDDGDIPLPPEPAYEQDAKPGQENKTFTVDEMWYETWDIRSYSRWTRSPTEYVLGAAIQFLATERWNLAWYTDGDGDMSYWECPPDWDENQVEEFNDFIRDFNASIESRMTGPDRLLPAGPKRVSRRPRGEAEFQQTSTQLIRRIIAAYDVNATVLGFEGQQYKVSQENSAVMSERWGNTPTILLLESVLNDIILFDLGIEAVELAFDIPPGDLEKLARTVRTAGPRYMSVNDGLKLLGEEPAEGPYVDCYYEVTPSGPLVLGWRKGTDGAKAMEAPKGTDTASEAGTGADAAPAPQGTGEADAAASDAIGEPAKKDLRKWQVKAERLGAAGEFEKASEFVSDNIPPGLAAKISAGIAGATSVVGVKEAFRAISEPTRTGMDLVRTMRDLREVLETGTCEKGSRELWVP